MKRALLGLWVVVSISGCGVEGDSASSPGGSLQALDTDLSLGATGEQVHTLNDYLRSRGYYPDAGLAALYPSWRPPVREAPTDPSVFDERTDEAVRRFQVNRGLPATGLVDAATRATIKDVLCGVPDNIPTLDPSDKFALNGKGTKQRGTLTWKLLSAGNLGLAVTDDAINTAFAEWTRPASGLSFRRATAGETPTFTFSFVHLPKGALDDAAQTGSPRGGTTGTVFNIDLTWTVGATGSGEWDLIHVAMHEIGHLLGFAHSSWRDSLMFAGGAFTRRFMLDDAFAASAIYDDYVQMPNILARDIAVGSNGEMWALNTETPNGDGNFRVVKFDPWVGWVKAEPASTSVGVRITVDQAGKPWVVRKDGKIFMRADNTTDTKTWTQISTKLATDIGFGGGQVWITNKTPVNGGFQVCKFVGGDFPCSNGGGVKVSVTDDGIPWIVSSNGDVFRHSNDRHDSGTWEPLSGRVSDIAVGPVHDAIPESMGKKIAFAWSVATNAAGKVNLAGYMEQPLVSLGLGTNNPPFTQGWLAGTAVSSSAGSLQAVAMRPDGGAVVVDNAGRVFKSPW